MIFTFAADLKNNRRSNPHRKFRNMKEMVNNFKIKTTEEMLMRILHLLEEPQTRSTSGNKTSTECRIYTNKELMKPLGVESRYLKNLRDNGYLSYSRHGDKYWYTQTDVDTFLKSFKYEAFANRSSALFAEGGVR